MRALSATLCAVFFLTALACRRMATDPIPGKDINAVLAENDRRLLAIPGVVGVYVGLMNDGQTSCLKVMVARDTPELKKSIPRAIDGYPVLTEVSGEIRPMQTR